MGKNKNRTDLLAAGREKLQQFRKKKENKGNISKSSDKSGKSGHESSVGASTEADVTPQNVSDGEVSVHEAKDTNDTFAPTGEPSVNAPILEAATPEPNLNQNADDGIDSENSQQVPDESSSLVLDDAKTNLPGTADPIVIEEESAESSVPIYVSFQVERGNREEDQVTDVGPIQEVGSSGAVIQLEEDAMFSSNEFESTSGNHIMINSVNIEAEESQDSHVHSIESRPISESSAVVKDQPRENTSSGLSNEVETETFSDAEKSFEVNTDDIKLDLSSLSDGNLIKLSQLAEILRSLEEDEFEYLLKSRESSIDKSRHTDQTRVLETLKEQLYATSYSKDAFHLQISEQQKFIDEISRENASFQRKNQELAEEIAKCKSELHFSKSEADGFSAKVNELQNKLEMTQLDMASVSSELVDCKSFMEVLKEANENLNGSFGTISEEKEKLLEENGKFSLENEKMIGELAHYKASIESLQMKIVDLSENLTLLKGNKRQLEEENDSILSDNSKLLSESTVYKSVIESLEEENERTNYIFTSISEEREKSQKEKELLYRQTEKLSKELMDGQDLSSSLQTEISVLNGRLESIAEERNKLEEEKRNILSELKEATFHLNQLSQENETLKSNSDLHRSNAKDFSGKINPSQSNDSPVFLSLKKRLDNAGIVIHKLENAIESMQLHLISSSSSSDKAVASGVSRLIHAFESKSHSDDPESGEIASPRNQTTQDPYLMTKMAIKDLRSLLNELVTDVENATEFCRGVMGIKPLDYDSLIEHINHLEEANVELMVLYEATKEHIGEISISCDTLLQKQELVLKSENSQLGEKLNIFEAKFHDLQSRLDETCRNYHETIASISDQVKNLQTEVSLRETFLEEEHNSVSNAYNGIHEKFGDLQVKNDMALCTLHRLYTDLSELVSETENLVIDDKGPDFFKPEVFSTLLDQMKKFRGEKLQLESSNERLNLEFMNQAREIDELEKNCLKPKAITKLVEIIENSLKKEGMEIYADDCEPASRLESLVHLLLQKYREATNQGLTLSTSLELQLSDLRGQVEQLHSLLVQYENENLVLTHSLKSAAEDVVFLNDNVREKVRELEQSENRVSSVREKLSIAVTKGKGLISQREGLKQSLAEMSQELLSKDARIQDLETRVKVHLEAGERMVDLESELSYIRNSATALRESFLLQDSTLQRIEEILEDLELPEEHFHSRDIIGKIEWLANSVKEEGERGIQANSNSNSNSNSSDDLRRRCDELESRFYGMAEQTEMLEQSLMERNNLVQKWEEMLDRFDMPSQFRSMEPEDKFHWLETALSEAQNKCISLQEKIDKMETFCGSLTVDLEDSLKKISVVELEYQQVCGEKEILSRDMEILSHENDESSKKISDFEIRNENLENEVNALKEQKLRIEQDFHNFEGTIAKLHDLIEDALKDSGAEDVLFDEDRVKNLEEMSRKLVEKYKTRSSFSSRGCEENDSLGELTILKEEIERHSMEKQSLALQIEALEVKKNGLEVLLNQEEQKSASLREKLNVAVRKGKSLVQQRDGMKQVIEDLNREVERLKLELKNTEKAISGYEEQIKGFSITQERILAMGSEQEFLRNRLAETEHLLQEKESILDALDKFDVGFPITSENPMEKLKEIGKSLQDSIKSKRAAELLLAELNEVQEQNDGLQEELAKAENEISKISKERDLAEEAKREAIAYVEKISEEKERQLAEFRALNSGVEQLREDVSAIDEELEGVLAKDLEVLDNVEAVMRSCLEVGEARGLSDPFSGGLSGTVNSRKSENKVFMKETGFLRDRLYNHSNLVREKLRYLTEVRRNIHREYSSEKVSFEKMKRDTDQFESIKKEKESQLHILRGHVSLLFETCNNAISEIDNSLAYKSPEKSSKSPTYIQESNNITEEGINTIRDRLLFSLKDFVSRQVELTEVNQREMKSAILNLQKELQEKDIQRERICTELVNQIKEAENNAKIYLHELKQVKVELNDLHGQMGITEGERKVLENRIKELQEQENNAIDLKQKVSSLTDALAAKEQETEALLHALDEEESQMEDLTNRITTLEKDLHQKNQDLHNLENSRAKALKKLSLTVTKFDELHSLSENLLSEVENLQSQLQEREGEISFLRQEVTRCTNDALSSTQINKKRNSDDIYELLMWLDSLIPRVSDVPSDDDTKSMEVNEINKEMLERRIVDLVSRFENLREVAQNSDMLLQEQRSKVEELGRKEQFFKNSLEEKETQIMMLRGAGSSAKATNSGSEIVEVEQMTNKWAPQVRSLRKNNNDQVAIAIDMDHNDDKLEDHDEDDKAHGFKSLTTSRIVPRFTRPVSDMIDGLWVSCDRALMRQPALRLSVIIYWAVMHALLATFVV